MSQGNGHPPEDTTPNLVPTPRRLLFVISGPSAAGKGGALRRIGSRDDVSRVPTYTTRPQRPVERNGLDYHFVSQEEFFSLVRSGEIVEYAQPYKDANYGSPRELYSGADHHRIVELDPAGYMRARRLAQSRVVGIFVYPGGPEEVQARLKVRDDTPQPENRIDVADEQIGMSWLYDYVLFNRDKETFHHNLDRVIEAELLAYEGISELAALQRASQEHKQAAVEAPAP